MAVMKTAPAMGMVAGMVAGMAAESKSFAHGQHLPCMTAQSMRFTMLCLLKQAGWPCSTL